MRRYGRISTVAVALILVLAACGGGDDSSDDGSASTSAGIGGDDGGVVTTFGNIPGLSDECTAVANLSVALSQALTGTFDGVPEGIVDALPADARADGRILADALDDFAAGLDAEGIDLSVLQGLGSLSPEQIEAFSDVSERVFTEEVDDAVERLSAAIASECAPGG